MRSFISLFVLVTILGLMGCAAEPVAAPGETPTSKAEGIRLVERAHQVGNDRVRFEWTLDGQYVREVMLKQPGGSSSHTLAGTGLIVDRPRETRIVFLIERTDELAEKAMAKIMYEISVDGETGASHSISESMEFDVAREVPLDSLIGRKQGSTRLLVPSETKLVHWANEPESGLFIVLEDPKHWATEER